MRVVSRVKQFELQVQFFLILVYGVLIAYPIIKTPLGTDDIWMSILQSYNGFHGIGFLDYHRNTIHALDNVGRMNHLGVLIQFLTTFLMENRLYYKIFLIAINIMLGLRIRRLLQFFFPQSMHVPNLSLVVFFAFGQIRDFYDPRTQLSGVLHITLILMINAVICWYKYKIGEKTLFLILFSLYSILAFYTYDLAFFIYLPFLIVVSVQSVGKFSKLIVISRGVRFSLLIIWVQYLIMLYVRYSAPALQEDAQLNFSRSSVSKTFIIQLFGSFPTTLFESKNVSGLSSDATAYIYGFVAMSFLLFFLLIVSFRNYLKLNTVSLKNNSTGRMSSLPLAIFGISLILTPAFVTAISPRFQRDVKDGLPYFGFLAQQVGIVFCIFLIFLIIHSIRKFLLFTSLSLIFAWFGVISFSSNQFLTHPNNQTVSNMTLSQKTIGWEREIIESGVRNGVLKQFEKNSVFSFMPQYSWTSSENLTRMNKDFVIVEGSPVWWNNTNNKVKNVCLVGGCSQYVIYPFALNYKEGFLAIGRIEGSDQEFQNLATRDWFLYVETDSNSLAQMTRVPCIQSDAGEEIDVLRNHNVNYRGKNTFFELKQLTGQDITSSNFKFCDR